MYRSKFTSFLTSILAAGLLAAFGTAPAAAQETGAVRGTVTLQEYGPVHGAFSSWARAGSR